MIGYKFMLMRMDGNRDGTDRKTVAMAMHMVEVMYAPSNDLTLMAMFPYLQLSMDHVTRKGLTFTTESQGIGDISRMAGRGRNR